MAGSLAVGGTPGLPNSVQDQGFAYIAEANTLPAVCGPEAASNKSTVVRVVQAREESDCCVCCRFAS